VDDRARRETLRVIAEDEHLDLAFEPDGAADTADYEMRRALFRMRRQAPRLTG
jgi:hypothetical protein